jgi:hypothetical protein
MHAGPRYEIFREEKRSLQKKRIACLILHRVSRLFFVVLKSVNHIPTKAMMRSFKRGVICSLWLPHSKVLACGNLECMTSSDDYRGGGGGVQSARKKNLIITPSLLVATSLLPPPPHAPALPLLSTTASHAAAAASATFRIAVTSDVTCF